MTLAGGMRVKGWKSPPIWTFDVLSDNTSGLKSGGTIDGDESDTIERQTQRIVHRNG